MATVQKYTVHTFMSFYVMNTEMNNDRTHPFFKMSKPPGLPGFAKPLGLGGLS